MPASAARAPQGYRTNPRCGGRGAGNAHPRARPRSIALGAPRGPSGARCYEMAHAWHTELVSASDLAQPCGPRRTSSIARSDEVRGSTPRVGFALSELPANAHIGIERVGAVHNTANDEIRSPWSSRGCEREPDLAVCTRFWVLSSRGRFARSAEKCMAEQVGTRLAHRRPLPQAAKWPWAVSPGRACSAPRRPGTSR
jgi:hypothetical protein